MNLTYTVFHEGIWICHTLTSIYYLSTTIIAKSVLNLVHSYILDGFLSGWIKPLIRMCRTTFLVPSSLPQRCRPNRSTLHEGEYMSQTPLQIKPYSKREETLAFYGHLRLQTTSNGIMPEVFYVRVLRFKRFHVILHKTLTFRTLT